jgi:hypothetical protein
MWSSTDGRRWTRLANEPTDMSALGGLTIDGSRLLAYGLSADGGGALWALEPASVRWSREPEPPPARFIADLRPVDSELIAILEDRDTRDRTVWRLSGGGWAPDPALPPQGPGAGTAVPDSVANTTDGVVVIGRWLEAPPDPDAPDAEPVEHVAVWVERGGSTWTPVGPPPTGFDVPLAGATQVADRLVVVGFDGSIWSHPLPIGP